MRTSPCESFPSGFATFAGNQVTQPEPTIDAGRIAADMQNEIQRLAAIGDEPTATYRNVRIPPWLVFTEEDDDPAMATRRPGAAHRSADNRRTPSRRQPMPTKVRIIIVTDDQVRTYHPSPQELHHFVPTGQLIAQLRRRDDGKYQVHHTDSGITANHHTYADALLSALRLAS